MKHRHVLAILYISTFFTVGLVFYSIKVAPFFTGILLLSICLILLFMAYETLLIHSAAEFENRFWTGKANVLFNCHPYTDRAPTPQLFYHLKL